MIEFLKERIALFVLLLAGDTVSLLALIKATELKGDAVTIAIAISLPLSLIISLFIKFYFSRRVSRRIFMITSIILSVVLWVGFIIAYSRFSKTNDRYGKVAYPKNHSMLQPVDSFIVGGCNYTPEAQAEVNDYAERKQTLTPPQLFEDFDYDVSLVWQEQDRDCARSRILNAFATMIAFLMSGITLVCELLIRLNKKPTGKQGAKADGEPGEIKT
jgi:hypothetical protein